MDKSLSGRRVLVVEDEMMIFLTIEDMLADLGCESVTALPRSIRFLPSWTRGSSTPPCWT
jgi:CheY-like chemotaxis protein